jgi:hypothetical protein
MPVRRIPASREEKIAKRLSELVNDYNLDLNEVGKYFARVSGLVSYNRIREIVLVAEEERELMEARRSRDYLF